MKIAYITGDFPKRSEQFIVREVEEMQRLGAEISVYPAERREQLNTPWRALGRHGWSALLPRTGRAVSRFPLAQLAAMRRTAWRHFPGGLGMAVSYAKDIRARGIEHVHAHWLSKPAAVGMMIAAMTRLPFTISGHAVDCFCGGIGLRQKVASARAVAVCNQAALDALASRIPSSLRGRLRLIRHGIDIAQFKFTGRREAHSTPRLLAAGRLVEKKGFRYLVEAMGRLPECLCEIAGAGELEDQLRREIEERGLSGRIHLSGWLPPEEIRARMTAADVLVVPSVTAGSGDRDGVPNVLLEAGAVGLPIVACDAGGVGEFVIDGETGRLVPSRNPGAIADAVGAALSDTASTRRLAENARKKVENEYDVRANARLMMELFKPAAQRGC